MEFIIQNWLAFITSGFFLALIGFIFNLLRELNKIRGNLEKIPEITRSIIYLDIELQSINHATAKQYGNGYMSTKEEKRNELIEQYKIKGVL